MKTLFQCTLPLFVSTLFLVPIAPSVARADDDDWEDRWEEREEEWEEAREEAEDRWDDDRRFRRYRRYHDGPYGYREYYYPRGRSYYYDRGPSVRYYYPDERRVYRYYGGRYPRYYGGHVHAGPADVYYGRHGSVRIGPLRFYW